jgi:hypothetical protein
MVAVDAEKAALLRAALEQRGVLAAEIGRFLAGEPGCVRFR